MVLPKQAASSFDPFVVIYPSKSVGRRCFTFSTIPKQTIDSLFFCLKIDFRDSTKIKKSFTKILHMTKDHSDFTEVEDTLNNSIKSYFIKNKYWKPPFMQ